MKKREWNDAYTHPYTFHSILIPNQMPRGDRFINEIRGSGHYGIIRNRSTASYIAPSLHPAIDRDSLSEKCPVPMTCRLGSLTLSSGIDTIGTVTNPGRDRIFVEELASEGEGSLIKDP